MIITTKKPNLPLKAWLIKSYQKSSEPLTCILSPWCVTGTTDAEGNFSINIQLKANKIHASFKVTQKTHSKQILIELQKYFNCGSVIYDNKATESHKFVVNKLDDLLLKVIPHFDKYRLVLNIWIF